MSDVALNVENFDKWVAALRSGKYAQGAGQLFQQGSVDDDGPHPDRYCCLGVGCKVMALPLMIWHKGAMAPLAFIKWLGIPVMRYDRDRVMYLTCPYGELRDATCFDITDDPDSVDRSTAAQMNDDGEPFPVIADWLVANRDRLVAIQ